MGYGRHEHFFVKIADKMMNLPSVGKTNISCAGEKYESNVFKIDIFLPNQVGIKSLKVTEFKDNLKFDVLIGMDVINFGDFSITNANGLTYCSFRIPPDYKHIDYVEVHNHKLAGNKAAKQFKKKNKK